MVEWRKEENEGADVKRRRGEEVKRSENGDEREEEEERGEEKREIGEGSRRDERGKRK